MTLTDTSKERAGLAIRSANAGDLERINAIYDAARRYMRAQRNFSQWSGTYPSVQSALADMRRGWCFVVEADGAVVATFCLMTDPEPTYSGLPEALSVPYVTLHRVASDGTVRGILAAAVAFATGLHHCDIRIDTHADNVPMLTAIARLGFIPTGPIPLGDGSTRLSFRLPHNP